MQKIHFFKAHTRLGMRNIPWGSSEFNIGVENGPDGILTKKYLANFLQMAEVTAYRFPNPQKVKKLHYKKTLSKSLGNFTKIIWRN
mgnify:CR=1 FL=1